jgi:hypothetical protein
MQATIDFNLRSAAHLTHFFVVTPFEGTTMFRQLDEAGDIALQDQALLGYQGFPEGENGGSLSTVPRSRIEQLIVDATQKFFFTGNRLKRLLELTSWGHNHTHLAQTIEARRWCAGLTFETMDREAAIQLAQLYGTAKNLDPKGCVHLPSVPAEFLQEVH